MDKIWLAGAMASHLPYFEREDKDDFLYIATYEQLFDAAGGIVKAYKKRLNAGDGKPHCFERPGERPKPTPNPLKR